MQHFLGRSPDGECGDAELLLEAVDDELTRRLDLRGHARQVYGVDPFVEIGDRHAVIRVDQRR